MSGGLFSYALLGALAIALLVAAFTDLRRREIDNWLNAAIATAAPLWWLAAGLTWVEVGFQVALAALTFVLACVLFATRQMGGGDVKLLTALALWFAPLNFMQVMVLMAVLGGGASVAMAIFNMQRMPGEIVRDAIAALAALAWIWCAGAFVIALTTHRPLIGGETIAAIDAVLPRTWLLALAALGAALIFAFGFLHMIRRQKSRLPVPYGIAIAAAGLWVLGEQTLSAARLAVQAQ